MPRRGSGKRYVQRDSIRDNPDLALEIRFVLVCAEYIRPKFLAVPAWLVAAGALGLNLAELRELTGLGTISCENTLETLAARDLASEQPPTLPGESSRWFAVLDYDQGKGLESQEGKESKEGKGSCLINPEGIYNTRPCDNQSPESRGDKTVSKTESGQIEGPDCNGNPNDSSALRKNPVTVAVPSLTFGTATPEVRSLPAPRVAKRRRKILKAKPEPERPRKKLKAKQGGDGPKKTESGTPRAALSTDLTAETSRRYGGGSRFKTYLKNPSENPAVTEWKQKPKPNRWGPLDWVGYWLHQWREFYGEEDPNFVDQTLYRSIARSRERTKGGLDIYWSTGFQIERFRDSARTFKGNGIEVKEFIDWLFGTFLPENAGWMDTPVSAQQIFRVTGNFFLDKYKVRNVKPVKPKDKKPKGKWHPWGYTYDD